MPQWLKLLHAALASHLDALMVRIQAASSLVQMFANLLEKQQKVVQVLGPYTHMEESSWIWALDWPRPSLWSVYKYVEDLSLSR